MSDDEHIIHFDDPSGTSNEWHGSMRFDPIHGCRVRVAADIKDPRTDFREPLAVYAVPELPVTADFSERMILVDMDREGGGFSLGNQKSLFSERFNAKVLVKLADAKLKDMASRVMRFTIRSPIIFSFINHHAYKTTVTKKRRRFAIKDRPFKCRRFESQVFSAIKFDIEREISNASSGNLGKIEYSASASFIPRKSMRLWDVLRLSQIFEKLLFILVGDQCGPMVIEVTGGRRRPARAEIKCASPLYENDDVVVGIWRCWTLNKTKIDIGALLDEALARYRQLEVPIELIIDAATQKNTQDKFFRLVRSMEAIARELMPKGSEELPRELIALDTLVAETGDADLKSFFERRVKPVFAKTNTLGYGIDIAKVTFPYQPVVDLDKQGILRLRGIEAHARAHSFTSNQLNEMHGYNNALDFLCRACVLFSLGVSREQIAAGIPNGRFSWLVDNPTS